MSYRVDLLQWNSIKRNKYQENNKYFETYLRILASDPKKHNKNIRDKNNNRPILMVKTNQNDLSD